MKLKGLLCFILIIFFIVKTNAQCNTVETIYICDMTQIDYDTDGTPDGIINLYDEYNALPGVTPISLASGFWFDPGINFALDELTGDLITWNLDVSSTTLDTFQFLFFDPNSGCPDNLIITLNVVIGPFQGVPLPPSGPNEANVTICEAVVGDFDLFQVFESLPSPHQNGVWAYLGNLGDDSNFISLSQDGTFEAQIPYVPFGNLIEFDVFEFSYTVPGIAPCDTSATVNFKVEVIRDVQSGVAADISICESEMLAGVYDQDINLLDDEYLIGEDLEGVWMWESDPTGQLSGPLDSTINLREIYDDLVQNNPRFGCVTFGFTYMVDARATLSDCPDKESTIEFTFFEDIRPFSQPQPLEICTDGTQPPTINLYDQIVFTTENGILFDYPSSNCTNWSFVSGPSDLGLITNTGSICSTIEDPGYTSQGTINVANITNADAGIYVFEFTVSPDYVCATGQSPCSAQSTLVTLVIHPYLYAGEDTGILEFCESDFAVPTNLVTLLNTNGVDDPIYQGPLGVWTDLDTGAIITNPFTLPQIDGQQTFNFNYTTTTENGCIDSADLTFLIYEQYRSGIGSTVEVCSDENPFNLFDTLTGDVNMNGTWTGPNGFTTTDNTAIFDPSSSTAGNYIYTVPDNTLCAGSSTTVIVIVHQKPSTGNDVQETVCKSDLQVDLLNILDPQADSGGTFIDTDNTNALSGSVVDLTLLQAGTYNFEYQIQGNLACTLSSSFVTITVIELDPPTASNQTFCASDGATIEDLVLSNADDFNWYDTISDTNALPFNTLLINGEDYFVAAVDANGCESPRTQIVVTLLPLDHPECELCINDGISDNGDGENDVLDLCNLPEAFPNFEINIYNRYGTKVFKGNRNTPPFDGTSNVPMTIGDRLSSGVYFYVFDPRDGVTAPFQGDVYLSR